MNLVFDPAIVEEERLLAALQEIEEQQGGRKAREIISSLIWFGAQITAREKQEALNE